MQRLLALIAAALVSSPGHAAIYEFDPATSYVEVESFRLEPTGNTITIDPPLFPIETGTVVPAPSPYDGVTVWSTWNIVSELSRHSISGSIDAARVQSAVVPWVYRAYFSDLRIDGALPRGFSMPAFLPLNGSDLGPILYLHENDGFFGWPPETGCGYLYICVTHPFVDIDSGPQQVFSGQFDEAGIRIEAIISYPFELLPIFDMTPAGEDVSPERIAFWSNHARITRIVLASAVPEPAESAMWMGGLAVVGAIYRRKRMPQVV